MSWLDLLFAGASHAMDRTNQYNQTLQAQEAAANVEERWNDYLNRLRSMYAPELAGEVRPGERKAVDSAVEQKKEVTAEEAQEATNRMLQNLYRAGIRGGDLASSNLADIETSKEEIIANYQRDLENQLLERAAGRQTQAKNLVAQMEADKNQAVAPYDAAYDQLAAGLSSNTIDPLKVAGGALAGYGLSEMAKGMPYTWAQNLQGPLMYTGAAVGDPVMAQYMAKPLAAYMLGGAGNMFGGDYNPEAMATQQAAKQALNKVGLDPSMFAQPDEQLPHQVGNTIYTPKKESDFLGNQRTTYEKSPAGSSLTGYQRERLQNADAKEVAKAAKDYTKQHEWTTAQDQRAYQEAVEEALKTGAPLPEPTDNFGKREYRPKKTNNIKGIKKVK